MQPALTDEETLTLIDYARRKYAEERWPLSADLRQVREALAKLDAQPARELLPPRKPYVPSLAAQRRGKTWNVFQRFPERGLNGVNKASKPWSSRSLSIPIRTRSTSIH